MAGRAGTLVGSMPAKKAPDQSTYSGKIAARIRQLREAKGWTVAELQERLNTRVPKAMRVAQSTVHSWDSGGRSINPDYLPAIAGAFGLTVGGFMPKE